VSRSKAEEHWHRYKGFVQPMKMAGGGFLMEGGPSATLGIRVRAQQASRSCLSVDALIQGAKHQIPPSRFRVSRSYPLSSPVISLASASTPAALRLTATAFTSRSPSRQALQAKNTYLHPGVNSLLWLAKSLVIAAAIVACAFRYSPVVLTYQTVNSFYSFDHWTGTFKYQKK
jgi:hypothetical protein